MLQFAELSVKYRPTSLNFQKITSSNKAYNALRTLYEDDTINYNESFIALFLNRDNVPISYSVISTGGLSACIVDPKIVFSKALLSGCSGIILSHNHPSGQTRPSQADEAITKKLKDAGELLDITILDHIIVTDKDYYSFADNGNIL